MLVGAVKALLKITFAVSKCSKEDGKIGARETQNRMRESTERDKIVK